jgi:hypothetical protein
MATENTENTEEEKQRKKSTEREIGWGVALVIGVEYGHREHRERKIEIDLGWAGPAVPATTHDFHSRCPRKWATEPALPRFSR